MRTVNPKKCNCVISDKINGEEGELYVEIQNRVGKGCGKSKINMTLQ